MARGNTHRLGQSRRLGARETRIATVAGISAITWVVAYVLAFVSPLGQPVIRIELSSTSPGFSQMFFADDDQVFSEERSVSQPVARGDNTLAFPLKSWRGTVGSKVRWDPLDQPAEMTVTRATFTGAGISENIPLTGLRPSVGMGEIAVGDGGAILILQSNDPQALVDAASEQFLESSRTRAIAISTLLAVLAAFLALILTWRLSLHGRRSDIGSSERLESAPSSSAFIRVPTWVVAGSSVVAIAALVILIVGSQDIGVSWDEPGHEVALAEYFRSGWFVPRYLFVDGVPDTLAATVYAPAGWLLTHVLGVLRGVHPWALVPITPDAYAVRHLATALVAALSLVAVVVIARMVLRSWRWALLSAAVLGSLPLFIGHGMFNTKDVAVASGFTVFTLGIVLLVQGPARGRRWTWAGVSVASGAALAVGTRPGVWVGLMASAVVAIGVATVLDARQVGAQSGFRIAGGRCTVVVVGSGVAYALLWVVYPAAFGAPDSLFVTSLGASADFAWSGETLTAGLLMPAQPPWTYLPLWLGAQLPLLISVAAVVGVVALVSWFIGAWNRDRAEAQLVQGGVPILMQALSVPIGAIVLGATLYGGVRQLLFVLPGIALLATLGIYAVAKRASESGRSGLMTGLWIIVVVGLVVPTIAQIRLFPYSFAYFNAIAASRDINGNWDVDGWWLSARELVEENSLPDRVVCAESPSRPVVDCHQLGVVAPYLPVNETDTRSAAVDTYTALSRYQSPLTDDRCRSVADVSRPVFWQQVRLSSIEECTVSLAMYPDGGVDLSGIERTDPQLLWGWSPYLLWGWGSTDPEGVWTQQAEASLGFVLPAQATQESTSVTIVMRGVLDLPGDDERRVAISVNGVPAGEIAAGKSSTSREWRFVVPEDAIRDTGSRRVVVTFSGLDTVTEDLPIGDAVRMRVDHLSLANL